MAGETAFGEGLGEVVVVDVVVVVGPEEDGQVVVSI